MFNRAHPECLNLIICLVLSSICITVVGCRCQSSKTDIAPEPTTIKESNSKSPEPPFVLSFHPNATAALSSILKRTSPKVIGFGEFHQQNDTTHVRSAIKRFSEEILPSIGLNASDLVVETWIASGNCGESEKQVVKQVDQISERPAQTENETIRLLKHAKAMGIQPHILEIECKDYDAVRDVDGGVNYLGLLELVGSSLGKKAATIVLHRNSSNSTAAPLETNKRELILLYGGAIHNDTSPQEGFEGVSFAPSLKKVSGNRYIEIDLLVPEFVETSELLRSEPWFPSIQDNASPSSALLMELSPNSYVIVFRRNVS